jgi:aryl-alcohol dehydrogenase-like predicted oxidoreductase
MRGAAQSQTEAEHCMHVAHLQTRPLGGTGVEPTVLGLGGEGVLRTFGYDAQAREVIHEALREQITYFDSARAYAGSERYYGVALGAERERIFLTSKAHDRTARGALAMLDQTLANMRVDHLDLWQVHDVRTREDLDAIAAPGGAYEAFAHAKSAGKTRFIGVTGHYDPEVLLAAIEELRFDTVLLPVNPCEAVARPFAATVGARAMRLGMGVIGMKAFSRGLLTQASPGASVQELTDYALSQPVHVVIIGCDSVEQVRANVAAVRRFAPMSEQRQKALERRLAPVARQMLYYRKNGTDEEPTSRPAAT